MLRPVVSVRFQVLFHSPHRGSFHLSLTVLVHYRSSNVFSLGKWASQLPAELACSAVLRIPARVCLVSLTGLSPSLVYLSRYLLLPHSFFLGFAGPTTPTPSRCRFGLLPFRSPLLREFSLFLRVLRCFSSPRSRCPPYLFQMSAPGHLPLVGFPIRTSPDIAPTHGSPGLFAVCHVLLRHLTPRHSPYALSSLHT